MYIFWFLLIFIGVVGVLLFVWWEWVNWLVEFGIEFDVIVVVLYDWCLLGVMLEE